MIYLLGYPRSLSYDLDWIQAYVDRYGDTRLVHLGMHEPPDMRDAELVVILHSATAQGVNIPEWVFRVEHRCPWVMHTGNDYKLFQEKRDAARRLSIDLLATMAPQTPFEAGNGIGHVEHVPHALNPKAFTPEPSYAERPVRVGFRGVKYPELLGDRLRNDVVEAFMFARESDVSWGLFRRPEDYTKWLKLCKSTPLTEAGLPGMKAVSSRAFDAIGSRVALIATPGEYSGCFGEEHYFRLEPDLSNIDETLERVDNPDEWERVTQAALDHVLAHHTYAHRMQRLDEILWQQPATAH